MLKHVVTKFGGTSVSSRKTWDCIYTIITNHIKNNYQPVIVCSAMTQISNMLDQAIKHALKNDYQNILNDIKNRHITLLSELKLETNLVEQNFINLEHLLQGISLLGVAPPKIKAEILSYGEILMTIIGANFLKSMGLSILWQDVRHILKSKTQNHVGDEINYLSARCEPVIDAKLKNFWLSSNMQAIITQGFFVANENNETVLLGRGGSDTSGALIAATLEANLCEIWTDVPGIYTANPHQIPQARLLKQLNYDEAQEIASQGAKVLHPYCLAPVRQLNIPMSVKYTLQPEHSGTKISRESDDISLPIKSLQIKHSITLISIDTLSMWQQVGFLADVFVAFKNHGFSVDLLSSSEFNVTVSLDTQATLYNRSKLEELLYDLNQFGRAKVIEPCSAVSLVGYPIRSILPQLGPIFEIFENKKIHLFSLASNDLNITFVVDESHAEKICQQLHQILIENNPQSFYYSKSWHEEFGNPLQITEPWWKLERDKLLKIGQVSSPCYVYNIAIVKQKISELKKLTAIDNIFYAIKANSNVNILRSIYNEGVGFECVSLGELNFLLNEIKNLDPTKVIFTPNFASKKEYAKALEAGCTVTIDNISILESWPDLFVNKQIILRLDPGGGAGHHKFVSTAGNESKFGIVTEDLPRVISACQKSQAKVIGLHAHSGSGILTIDLWERTANFLLELADKHFKEVKIINLGGGFGIVEKPGQIPINVLELDKKLLKAKSKYKNINFWIEPGRFLVAECGVLLAKVTQRKIKGKVNFVGIETGMNSLIRPALYGAYHEIVNLSCINQCNTQNVHIVGPICESSDTLGYDRPFPNTKEGDVVLIANVGAYGRVMSSNYNFREPAQEIILS